MNQRKDMALNNTKGLLFVQKGKQQKQRDFLRDKKSSKRRRFLQNAFPAILKGVEMI